MAVTCGSSLLESNVAGDLRRPRHIENELAESKFLWNGMGRESMAELLIAKELMYVH